MTPAQCRAARGALGIGQETLAAKTGVAVGTVQRFETGQRATLRVVVTALKAALEEAGVSFSENGVSWK